MQRDPLIRYTLNPDLVNTLRDDYGPPNHGKFSAAETLSQFDPSSQSVHQGDEGAPPGLLESSELPTLGGFKPFEGSPPTTQLQLTTRTAPPPEQWEANKASIWTHYIHENLPLPKLIKLMKTKYKFTARYVPNKSPVYRQCILTHYLQSSNVQETLHRMGMGQVQASASKRETGAHLCNLEAFEFAPLRTIQTIQSSK